ncbi:hypothetical protein IKG24_01580 [Candidatus Saccharibacteria bacterium]|nr:hypothetical protein [Candidatus Saccharibacteria bacterium]
MDATFLAKVKADYPDIRFITGKRFTFRPPRTVVITENFDPRSDSLLLLHEIGHALCGRWTFRTEVERLKIEVLAWEEAKKLATSYKIAIDEELIEDELNTYRDFLHQKSRCHSCGLTRFQTPDGVFHCPKCDI